MSSHNLFARAAIVCTLAFSLAAAELPRTFDEHRFYQDYHTLSRAIETPHMTWGKPARWDGLRVLVIAPSWGQRETVELEQRFGFALTSLMTLRHNAFAGITSIGTPLSAEQVTGYFERDLLAKQYDVIVMSRTRWELYPSQYRYDILRKVHEEGTGLLLIDVGQHPELDQLMAKPSWDPGLRLEGLTPLSYVRNGNLPRTRIAGVQFGAGRVLQLNWQSLSAQMILTPWQANFDFDWEYDHYLGVAAQAILAVSGKVPALRLQPAGDLTVAAGQTGQTLNWTLSGEGSAAVERLELLACSADYPQGQAIGSGAVRAAAAGVSVTAGLVAGQHLLLALCRDGAGRLCGWSYFALTVTAPATLAELSLARSALARAGEPVEGTLRLQGEIPPATPVLLRVFDIDQRLVVEQTLPVNGQERIAFRFPAPAPLRSSLFHLEASLGALAPLRGTFTVQGRQRPTFSFGAWVESQTCYISHCFYQSMAAHGIDGIFYSNARGDSRQAAPLLAKNGLFSIPHFWNYTPDRDRSDPARPVNRNNLNDPEYLAGQQQKMRELAAVWNTYDVHSYTDGSDKSRGGNSFDDLSKAAFRSWLDKRYPSLAALNAKLGTAYSSLADIDPQPLDLARSGGTLPLWIEYNRFFEERFLNYFTLMREAGQESDLNGACYLGPDGFGRLDPFEFAGLYELLKTVTYFNLYTYQDPPQMEIARSLLRYAPQVKYRTIYAGSYGGQYMHYPFMRTIPWYMLFHDYTGYFWYMGNGKLTFSSEGCMAFMPDLRPSEGFLVSASQIAEIRQGLAELVAASRRQNNKIAVLYCHTSVAAATVDKKENLLRQSLSELQNLLEDCGLQYEYIPPQEVVAGVLEKEFRVLFMPDIRVLAADTLAALNRFAAAGGLIVADSLPGAYDDVLRPGPAEELRQRFNPESGPWRLHDWKNYNRVRQQAAGGGNRKTLLAMLAEHGEQPTRLTGDGTPGLEKVEYRLPDGAWLTALLNYPDTEREVTLELPAGEVLYDVRNGQTVSHDGTCRITIPGGDVRIFCRRKGALPALDVSSTDSIAAGEPGKWLFRQGDASNAYHLRVTDAAGRERREYGATVLAGQPYVLQTALNDPVGSWTLSGRDAISGTTFTLPFTVSGNR